MLQIVNRRISIDAYAAAALAAEGKTQVKIAESLKLSQSAVSRLLKETQEFIQTKKTFRWETISTSLHEQIRRRMAPHESSDRIATMAQERGHRAPKVHVVPMDGGEEAGQQFETFAKHAADVLSDLLRDATGRVGVAWGSTLWHTTQALRTLLPQHPFREHTPLDFVPLCGDPLIDSQERYADRTSSRIVSELSRIVNGDTIRPPWIGLVPAFIPRQFKKNEIRVIDKLIDLVPQYPVIFGPRLESSRTLSAPLASDLSMIITAAGPSKHPLGFGRNPLLGLLDVESEQLAEHIYGDIGGVLLPRLPNDAPAGRHPKSVRSTSAEDNVHPLVNELRKRWTGLRLDHLRVCAQRATAEGANSRPGVVLLSFGASHVDVALEAVRQGLVNHLIIGSDLEKAIMSATDSGH